ncbi:MAG: tryptophan--tRNA ligase, partial [Clostridia bacterium]|nr:tryptophan--tRNA ligase [Clostridia bacterium]
VFKDAVADAVIAELEPIQQRYRQISTDKAYLNEVMTTNAERARGLAQRTLLKVRRRIGLAALKL